MTWPLPAISGHSDGALSFLNEHLAVVANYGDDADTQNTVNIVKKCFKDVDVEVMDNYLEEESKQV